MSGNWPDPARPGVPMNPERDGAHWLLGWNDKPFVAEWYARLSEWEWPGGDESYTGVVEAGWRYLGPCLTPAEVAAREAAAYQRGQREALERLAVRLQDRALVEQPVGDDWGYTRAGLQLGAEIARTMEIQETPDAAE